MTLLRAGAQRRSAHNQNLQAGAEALLAAPHQKRGESLQHTCRHRQVLLAAPHLSTTNQPTKNEEKNHFIQRADTFFLSGLSVGLSGECAVRRGTVGRHPR